MTDGRTGIAIAGAAITDGCGPSLPTIWSQEMRRRNLLSLVLSCFLILTALPVGSAATRLLGAPAAAAAPAGDTDHFKVRYHEWDQDVIDETLGLLEQAYNRVTTTLDYQPDGKTLVYLTSAYALDPVLRDSNTLAVSLPADHQLHVFSPESYGL